jgi:hypothetical protein
MVWSRYMRFSVSASSTENNFTRIEGLRGIELGKRSARVNVFAKTREIGAGRAAAGSAVPAVSASGTVSA